MKRKQKTPRRIRPTESTDVDGGNRSPEASSTPAPSATKTKMPKLEAETQTETMETIKMTLTSNVDTSKPSVHLEATFENERRSNNENMPLILNVFSLSEGIPRNAKQLDALSKQGNRTQMEALAKQANGFPVTPPCSPPLIQLGAFKAIPYVGQSSQVPMGNTNSYGFVRGSQMVAQDRINACGDPRLQYAYQSVNQMANKSHLIANGVLPMQTQQPEHRTYRQQVYVADTNSPPNSYYNSHVGGSTCSSNAPISQLASVFTLGDKYLVPKESFVTKGTSNLYTRFKLQHNSDASENISLNHHIPPGAEFSQTSALNPLPCIAPKNDSCETLMSYLIHNTSVANNLLRNRRCDVGVGTEACSSSNSAMPNDNQIMCTQSFRQAYGHNDLPPCDPKQTSAVAPNGSLYATRAPVPLNERSRDREESPWSSASSGDESTDFLSPRDARVQKLKKLLEEQEAKVNSLRTTH